MRIIDHMLTNKHSIWNYNLEIIKSSFSQYKYENLRGNLKIYVDIDGFQKILLTNKFRNIDTDLIYSIFILKKNIIVHIILIIQVYHMYSSQISFPFIYIPGMFDNGDLLTKDSLLVKNINNLDYLTIYILDSTSSIFSSFCLLLINGKSLAFF